ncbi:MAG: high-potential iron-sulfur protein [Candidatus Competibacteraceae bacterium]|nr:high-potential iron-sulfur protein [Candidatus Competibacteraceae bacterium]MCB1822265.1 high-potential iron-sulfur protein [Candidatus Competibacteraceae bacterium]HRY15076.1 high-potential iron-sulfur protein [Candidatus Competibacteraceae bacterium]
MDHHAPDNSRRRFIKLTAIGLAAAPFANALLNGTARAADMVSESDPQASALGYVADATKSDKRTDTTAACHSCGLYTGKEGEASGPCAIFQGKLVAANGWCTAWVKKAG